MPYWLPDGMKLAFWGLAAALTGAWLFIAAWFRWQERREQP